MPDELTDNQAYWIRDIELNFQDAMKDGQLKGETYEKVKRETRRIVKEGDWRTALMWIDLRKKDEDFIQKISRLVTSNV